MASLVSLHSGVLLAECPELEFGWTRTIGGTGEDHANDLAVDAEGNVLITGWFSNTVDFDPTDHVESHTSRGRKDV